MPNVIITILRNRKGRRWLQHHRLRTSCLENKVLLFEPTLAEMEVDVFSALDQPVGGCVIFLRKEKHKTFLWWLWAGITRWWWATPIWRIPWSGYLSNYPHPMPVSHHVIGGIVMAACSTLANHWKMARSIFHAAHVSHCWRHRGSLQNQRWHCLFCGQW